MGKRGGAKKGERRGGRQRGTPNRVTQDARVLFVKFVNKNAAKANQLWLTVAKTDPARALDILGRLAEFVVPKLTRSEHSGPRGGPIPIANANANVTDADAVKAYLNMVSGNKPDDDDDEQ